MVSVCMATKNGATFIHEQLSSILAQLGTTDEVVVSDDCSTDNTLSVIRSFQDSRIRLLESRSEKGITKNFELTIAASRGDMIFLADQDDVWSNDKVNRMKEALEKNDLVVCDCKLVDDRLQTRIESFYRLNNSGKGVLKNLLKNSYMGCCMAFTARIKERILPFPPDIPMHDIWIGIIADLYYRVDFIPEVLVLHRRHYTNASTTGNMSRKSVRKKVLERYSVLKSIICQHYGR